VNEFNNTCQDCGESVSVFEMLLNDDPEGSDYQVWCYCEDCDIETFHDYDGD